MRFLSSEVPLYVWRAVFRGTNDTLLRNQRAAIPRVLVSQVIINFICRWWSDMKFRVINWRGGICATEGLPFLASWPFTKGLATLGALLPLAGRLVLGTRVCSEDTCATEGLPFLGTEPLVSQVIINFTRRWCGIMKLQLLNWRGGISAVVNCMGTRAFHWSAS